MAKITKAAANYRPKDGRKDCGNCVFMNNDGSCDKVQGQVKPTDVCDLWKVTK